MRVMISQPMNGLTAEQIREKRAEVVATLEAEGHEIVDTVFTETPPENGNQALWYLGKAFQAISIVDAVYFMDGWELARGCRLEYEAAAAYGIRTINAEWRELKSTFSVAQTLHECFPDEMKFGESVEEVANRMSRYCREMCNRNGEYWKMVKSRISSQ